MVTLSRFVVLPASLTLNVPPFQERPLDYTDYTIATY